MEWLTNKQENILLGVCLILLVGLSFFGTSIYFNNKLDAKDDEISVLNATFFNQLEELNNMSRLKSQYLLESENKRTALLNTNNKLELKIDDYKDDIDDLEDDLDNLEDDLDKLEKSIINLEDPEVLGTMTGGEITALLNTHTTAIIYISDNEYSLTSKEEAKRYNEETKVQYNRWLSEEFDCDEFAAALYGFWNLDKNQFAFGIAWSNTHAFNIMVDEELNLWIIEPQSNSFIAIEDAVGIYEITRFVII